MARFGAHAFLWIGDWTAETGNHAIAEAGKAGFDFIEIPLLRPAEFDPAAHGSALEDAGIDATASLVLPNGAHMPEAPQKAIDFLLTAMDKLAGVGGHYLCGCLTFTLGYLPGRPPKPEEREVVVETMRVVAKEAAARDITLGCEAVNRYETYLYNSLGDLRETILTIGADNVQLHADTYHMNIEEEGYYQPLVEAADVLGYMHMSESHRGQVGTGTVNWDEVFRGLKDAHYRGPLVLESFAAVNPDLAAATCLWRPPNAPPGELAHRGLQFLRAKAEEVRLVDSLAGSPRARALQFARRERCSSPRSRSS